MLSFILGTDDLTSQMEEIDVELRKFQEKIDEKKDRLVEVQKHKTLMEIQRSRTEEIERELKQDELLIFFDFTKYKGHAIISCKADFT